MGGPLRFSKQADALKRGPLMLRPVLGISAELHRGLQRTKKGPLEVAEKSALHRKKAGRLARLHVHGPDESEHLACLLGLFQKGIHPRIDGFRTERAGMPVSRSAGSSIVMLFVLHRLGQRLIIIGCQFLPHETPCQVVIDAGRRFSETQGPKAVGREGPPRKHLQASSHRALPN